MTDPAVRLARACGMDLHPALGPGSGSRLFAGRSRRKLFRELHRIHRTGPVGGRRLRPDGQLIDYQGKNAGGYTLEALLGIRPNGRPDPDFEGWEIKAHNVRDLMRSGNALLTLFSSQPAGGFYDEEGPEAFVRKFGYAATDRRPGKINLYADHFVGRRNPKTGLTLDLLSGTRGPYEWCDPSGALVLSADGGLPAAIWPLAKLADHWNRKHALTAYVPYVSGRNHYRSFHYGCHVGIGQGTNFDRFLHMLAVGRISYDPALTLADRDSPRCRIRRRGLFRIRAGDLPGLYESFDLVDTRRWPAAADGLPPARPERRTHGAPGAPGRIDPVADHQARRPIRA